MTADGMHKTGAATWRQVARASGDGRAPRIGRQLVHAVAVLATGVAALHALAAGAVAQPSPPVTIAYVARENDPEYETRRGGADGVYLPIAFSPRPGAELGIAEAQALARAAGVSFALETVVLTGTADAASSIADLAGKGVVAALVDLPRADVEALRAQTGMALFNIRHADDALRQGICRPSLLHTLPSLAMETDALAQFLARKGWRRALVLQGPEPEDAEAAGAFKGSAKKFGLRIVETRSFEASRDPRRREVANAALLTADIDYDAAFVADHSQDFSRTIAYRASKPRIVVGAGGLGGVAWSPFAERFGAPQLNRRFERSAGRSMQSTDWAAWVAVRAIVDAVARRHARDQASVLAALYDPGFTIDLSKGTQGSFRAWDGQLRQPMLLATTLAVVDYAPLDGFLHERTTLDTLGIEPSGARCD